MCDSQIFLKKSTSGKNGEKWPKNMVFGLFEKITSLVSSEICVKWKFLWFINVLWKLHAWEKSGSQVIAKNCSWPMRFQYSLIVNISLKYYLTLIFGLNERSQNEWNKQGSLTGFLKKLSFEEMGHFGPKNCTSSSVWIPWKIFF